ncbi:hypothetical protein B7435_24095 [Mycolicibacterium peregrinum]|nr:hypothetical protein B7435_24095 [Mycolicibacterium peregrinum]
MSHDCALDKMNGRGLATIERLAFVSVRNVTSLDTQRQKMLRDKATELAPFEVQYIGNLDGIGEAYVALSDPYYVPAQYFGVEARVFPGLPEDEKRLAITAHDTRIGRLGTDSVELFREKWNAYWTRVVPE